MEKTSSFRLDNLRPEAGSRKTRKRVGRGEGTGLGKTCGRGQKGQKSRSGGSVARHFEGGQMPLYRRIPKLGFRSRNQKNGKKSNIKIVDISLLSQIEAGSKISREELGALIGVSKDSVLAKTVKFKLLGKGPLENKIEVEADMASAGALAAIEAAGGKVSLVSAEASAE